MSSLARTLAVVFVAVGAVACTGDSFPSRDALRSPSPSSSLPTCGFAIGDTVRRAGAGAVVPPLSKGVVGNFDGVTSSGSINIATSPDGIVTIKSKATGQPEKIETCKLP